MNGKVVHTGLRDVSSNIATSKGTFVNKQAVILSGVAVVVFEIKLTTNIFPGTVFITGIPTVKGTYVNLIASNNNTPFFAYTENTKLVANQSADSGSSISGFIVYPTNE